MALIDRIPFGMSLPHRSPDPIAPATVRGVAQRAEALGFRDLWVTENTLDHVTSFDPVAVLTYAAAVTSRIRLGASVLVLPVHDPRMTAHQWASLDALSGGRAVMGVGIGRPAHYREFEVPPEGRVGRFREQLSLIRALWSQERVTFKGRFYDVETIRLGIRPVQQPLPIWAGVGHPDAIRRAAALADGWMGAGGSTTEDFRRSVPILKAELEKSGRDPDQFPISKRIFMAIDDDPAKARAMLHRWYAEVYHNPAGTETSGLYGTAETIAARLEEFVAMGANHLLLNPIANHQEQLEACAAAIGASG
ncbi:LLM class flavin-dependent oxidoreductase [Rhodopila sp.]|uniref:LLM class flavin-dependent oxidoreductase n=1 Tax=Rhodopila sp. TaxID=2480087 RepID=UPI002D7EB2AA|nr:LLM class flavin-dependent oxidoreductase [Rhodopila sp.]